MEGDYRRVVGERGLHLKLLMVDIDIYYTKFVRHAFLSFSISKFETKMNGAIIS